MTEKRVSVRLVAEGGRQVRAELEGVGTAGARGFGRLSREMDLANARVAAFARRATVAAAAATAARLFRVMNMWLGRLPGGLALATIAMCAIFAAAAGVVGAVEVMIGMMAIPAMQKARYDNALIAGTICAGGSLGTMIPPSVIAVMYASLAQMSVSKLLAGMMIPGLLMVVLFLVYIAVHGALYPTAPEPGDAPEETYTLGEKLRATLVTLLPVCMLIFAVLGSILAVIASPTEAAAVGALGALVLCVVNRRFSMRVLSESLSITVRIIVQQGMSATEAASLAGFSCASALKRALSR